MNYAIIILFTFVIAAHDAYAYIGPGVGVALIGTFFGFAAAVVASVVMIIAWPIWIIYKKCKAKKAKPASDVNPPPSA